LAVGRLGVELLEHLADGRLLAVAAALLVPVGAVEHRRGDPHGGLGDRARLLLGAAHRLVTLGALPTPPGRVAEVSLEHLAHVHAAGHAEGVEGDSYGHYVREVWM